MNNNHTEIVFVLDRSGSMQSCQEAAIAGFNRFLVEQQQLEGLVKLTLVLFDDEYLVPINALPAAEVLPLDDETYVPRGSTALLDAIGRAVDDLGARLACSPESDRPGQVIVAILTDGLENSRKRYSWRQISALIKHQSEKYQWTFLFLGANQDAIATCGANEYRGIERGHLYGRRGGRTRRQRVACPKGAWNASPQDAKSQSSGMPRCRYTHVRHRRGGRSKRAEVEVAQPFGSTTGHRCM
jgi:hypothetical protein